MVPFRVHLQRLGFSRLVVAIAARVWFLAGVDVDVLADIVDVVREIGTPEADILVAIRVRPGHGRTGLAMLDQFIVHIQTRVW